MITAIILPVLLETAFGFPAECAVNAPDFKSPFVIEALEKFVGTWELVKVRPDGVMKEARQLVFRKDYTYSALDKDGNQLWSGTFDLDPTSNPKVWNHRSDQAKNNGGDALGIYELDGDSLKVCVVVGRWIDQQWKGKPRPKELKIKGADMMIEMKRVKTDK